MSSSSTTKADPDSKEGYTAIDNSPQCPVLKDDAANKSYMETYTQELKDDPEEKKKTEGKGKGRG